MAKSQNVFYGEEESTFTNDNEMVNTPTTKEVMEPQTKNGVICNSEFVRVRKEASGTSEVLGILNCGDKVKIIGVDKGFKKIQFNRNGIGYISSNYCKEV